MSFNFLRRHEYCFELCILETQAKRKLAASAPPFCNASAWISAKLILVPEKRGYRFWLEFSREGFVLARYCEGLGCLGCVYSHQHEGVIWVSERDVIKLG